MPKRTDTPGVHIERPEKIGNTIKLRFKHPLLGKSLHASTNTTDGAEAKRIAVKLSAILHNPNVWRDLPSGTPPAIRRMWEGEAVDQDASDAINFINPKWEIDWLPSAKTFKREKAVTLIKKILTENHDLHGEVAVLKAKVANLAGLLKKVGHESAIEYAPKTLDQAISDYLSKDKKLSGTNASDRKKNTLRPRLKRFAKALPATVLVHEITARQVTDHLAEVEAGKLDDGKKPTHDTVRVIGSQICAMLMHQSSGTFRKHPVRQWLKTQLSSDDDLHQDDPYWLSEDDVDKLLEQLPQFWRDAAMVQWAGGFRPEELCNLVMRNISLGPEIRIKVDAIRHGGNTYWKPKTRNSYGDVHLPKFARMTIKGLQKQNSFLIFPNDKALHGGTAPRWKMKLPLGERGISRKYDDFQRDNLLWRPGSWTTQYLARLRDAAAKAGLEIERVDSRTLRRSAGKRILLASKYSLELTAACLRDLPETVRKHYARLLPKDVKQPE